MGNSEIPALEKMLRVIFGELDTDILFECFAGLLVKSGEILAEDLHVIPHENHRRNYRNDIIPAPTEYEGDPTHYFGRNEAGLIQIYTSRSAILDYLPEEFYAQPDNTNERWNERGERRSSREIEAYRDLMKEQLSSAHRFFRPLEIEYNQVRIQRELNEIANLENFDKILEALWGDFPVHDVKWGRFVRSLHLVPQIVGDLDKTRALIEYVLDLPVTLTLSIDESVECTSDDLKSLSGEDRILGFNVIFGSTVYDYLEICTLKINNLSTAEFYEYFDELTEGSKLLEAIKKYYFPLSVEVKMDFSINPDIGMPDDQYPLPVLGYSSSLVK